MSIFESDVIIFFFIKILQNFDLDIFKQKNRFFNNVSYLNDHYINVDNIIQKNFLKF